MNTRMLFLTKEVPSSKDDKQIARALAPLLAFAELLEDRPIAAIVIRRSAHNVNVVCLRATIDAVARLFDHPALAGGVTTASSEELVGSKMVALPRANPVPILLQSLIEDTTPPRKIGTRLPVFRKLVHDAVRAILFEQSRGPDFMRRQTPYTEPFMLLRAWQIDVPDDCTCMRLKCPTCSITRWERMSTMRKANISLPPGTEPLNGVRLARPDSCSAYLAGVNPFDWTRLRWDKSAKKWCGFRSDETIW